MIYKGPIIVKNLGGDEFTLTDWCDTPNLKELLVAQNPHLDATPDSFDLLTFDDVLIDPKIGTPSRQAMMKREYGMNLILFYH